MTGANKVEMQLDQLLEREGERTTGARLPLGSVVSGARPLGVARSLEQSSARFSSCGFYPTSVSETHPVQLERRNAYALRLKPPTPCRWLGCPWAALHRCSWGGAASALWGGGRVIQKFLQGVCAGKERDSILFGTIYIRENHQEMRVLYR